jgi:hypothetical protein
VTDQRDPAFPKKFCPRFGLLAVEMGFVTVEQVREAMGEQVDDDFARRPHRPLGDILVGKGWMSPREVDMVLEKLLELQKG